MAAEDSDLQVTASKKRKPKHKLIRSFASIKLAVPILLALATLTAWGTIVESQYDSATAKRLVYHSIYMSTIMAALAINLIAVMVDRWPWEKKHTGFVLAHIGILTLMAGSIITQTQGVDGSMNIGIGQMSDAVTVDEKDFTIFTSLTGERYTVLYDYQKAHDHDADFDHDDIAKHPISVALPEGSVEVKEFYPFAMRDQKITPSDRKGDGPAVRFQLQNVRANVVDWILQSSRVRPETKDLGPAQIILTTDDAQVPANPVDQNAIVMTPKKGSDTLLDYALYSRHTKQVVHGTVKVGDTVQTPWMGSTFKIVGYLPKAKELITFKPAARPTELTVPAIRIVYTNTVSGEKNDYWLGLNSLVKLFSDEAVYIVSYANRRIHLRFPVELKKFQMEHYEGTDRAASYMSMVDVRGLGPRTISMNEPLKHDGFTLYQSSFVNDEKGQPVASIFSVNRDPGRWIKYLGALIMVLGIIHMFCFKSLLAKKART